MKAVTIKLEVIEAQVLFTELHALIHSKEKKIEEALNVIADKTCDEFDKDIARERIDICSYQRRLYWNLCNQIKNSIFDTK